jgi:hypothetical protein
MTDAIIRASSTEIIKAADVPNFLTLIRPAWQAKDLIARVRRLLPSDPSSACQRIFNAAIHDLREKVIIAGIDIARDAAKQHKLPPIERAEDVEEYSTAKLIDLVYRMGLLSRAEWRRLARVYEIRRDLEHEDNEYEAQVEDCIYVFKTCVEVVLSRDPVTLLPVRDVKEIIEQPTQVTPDHSLLSDYEHAPQPRQEEITQFLVSVALDDSKPDIVRQNAFTMIRHLEPITQNPVKLSTATKLQERIARKPLDLLHARVAQAAGALPYLKVAQRRTFFEDQHQKLKEIGFTFRSHKLHGEALRTLLEVGGFLYCPPPVREQLVQWMVLAYIGERGGYGAGQNRQVFYSNTAAAIIPELIKPAAALIEEELRGCAELVKQNAQTEQCARRYEQLLDLLP